MFVKVFIIFILVFDVLHSSDTLTITVGGDVMLDRGVRKAINLQGSKYFTKYKKYFDGSDYGIVNLESAVTEATRKVPKQYNFKTDFASLKYLKEIGITHLNLANNHSIDYGVCALKETIEKVKLSGLIPFGHSAPKYEPEIIEKNGNRIAIFSSVMLKLPNYRIDTCQNVGINHTFTKDICKQISDYKKQHPNDFILVYLHWGWEDTNKVRESQKTDAKYMIQSGADIIIGTHPHVIQDIETINGRPIYYSIGNMIFDGKKKPGLILKLRILNNKLIAVEEIII